MVRAWSYKYVLAVLYDAVLNSDSRPHLIQPTLANWNTLSSQTVSAGRWRYRWRCASWLFSLGCFPHLQYSRDASKHIIYAQRTGCSLLDKEWVSCLLSLVFHDDLTTYATTVTTVLLLLLLLLYCCCSCRVFLVRSLLCSGPWQRDRSSSRGFMRSGEGERYALQDHPKSAWLKVYL